MSLMNTPSVDMPQEIQPLLDEYCTLTHKQLPNLIGAVYLHGSIALGAFDLHHSDIDFVTMINRRCTAHDLNTLAEIHHHLAQKYAQWTMDGSYLQWDDLGKMPEEIEPHPHVNNVFRPTIQGNGGRVMWWILKQNGVAVVGKDPKLLDIDVDWDALIADMHHNLNTYWKRFIREPRRIAWLYADDGIEWTVLGVLRQYYTFREDDIISKIGAGNYGLHHLPHHWHPIIQEAIHIRQRNPSSLYLLRVHRMIIAWRFLRYVIGICNLELTAAR